MGESKTTYPLGKYAIRLIEDKTNSQSSLCTTLQLHNIAYKLHICTAAIGCHRQTWPMYMSMSQNWVTRPNPMLYHRFPKFHYNPTDWRYKPRNHALLFVYSFVSPFNSKFIFQYILHYIPYFPHSIPIHNVYATSVFLLNLYTSIIFESPKTADPNSWGS